ncbi:MAG: GNAT family N-acetyltransferase [Desulfobacterales bacterium]|jgi:RimJ/RimL family protein N-acetyltransferase
MIVETKRLILRNITIDDAEFILRLVNEPSFVSNIGDKGLKNLDDAERFILQGYWTNQKRSGYGMFLVELKNKGDSIGGCGLLYRKFLDVTDIGFAFLPEYWNRGFAYEAAEAVLKYGHTTLGIKKIVGLTSADNLGSIKLLKKLGMDFEKTVKMSDDDAETVLYS